MPPTSSTPPDSIPSSTPAASPARLPTSPASSSSPSFAITNDDVIRAYAAHGDRVGDFDEEGDGAHRWLLNPTLFALIGEPKGKRVLDAGCGQGYLCRLLARRGAQVTGIEPAAPWYAAAVAHEAASPQGIPYLQADLSTLLTTHPELFGAFDVVIANMVLMDIPDYEAAIRSCAAVLVPGGVLVCTLLHPCFDAEPGAAWRHKQAIETREYLHPYTRAYADLYSTASQEAFGYLFHRPLSAYVNTLLAAGLALQRMVEPHLSSDEGVRALGNDRDCHVPSFIALCLAKG
ncbi:MAG TPA: methyltransferase domain-containing protein [Ktedonobacterales bacterium]|jgi:2-polyprenyl-3-methyl-5-hydroxy-6-metoxy-1,4-benzoquinol methylase|nr:methyltransferase domain-containing protein [Ktedonobacterales bacterium]